jgi:ABC-type multidrug transport system ATPase subunit
MASIIQVSGLTKQFKDIRAVDQLSFSVEEGDIYGFLGQNGAGKSTTIRMLLTLIAPSAGNIELFGMNLKAHRKEILRQVGAVIERPDLYNYMTAYDNISLFARMSGVKVKKNRLMEQLDLVGLSDRIDSKVRTYSQGMKQRLGIAIALVHDPRLIILDEPTNGLDPQGIADVRNLILDLGRNQKKTILISSHLLSEIELIASKVLIIDKGKKMREGPVSELFNPAKMVVELQAAYADEAALIIQQSKWYAMLKRRQKDQFVFEMNKLSIPEFVEDLASRGVKILQIQPRHSLEDYFFSLTTPNLHVESFAN